MDDLSNLSDLPTCPKCGRFTEADFSFAFQPIVNIETGDIYAYEALVRDRQTLSAKDVLDKVTVQNRYAFDQTCRVKAIQLAKQLNLKEKLSINFLPNAIYEPAHCIQSTIKAADECGFPLEQIMFEVTESEHIDDVSHLKNIMDYYQKSGFITALDDFGSGHSGLNMLSEFIPDLIKLDMKLVRDIDKKQITQVIVQSVLTMAKELNITILAEGVETLEEARYYQSKGVKLMQGYLFARPGYETLPSVDSDVLSQLKS